MAHVGKAGNGRFALNDAENLERIGTAPSDQRVEKIEALDLGMTIGRVLFQDVEIGRLYISQRRVMEVPTQTYRLTRPRQKRHLAGDPAILIEQVEETSVYLPMRLIGMTVTNQKSVFMKYKIVTDDAILRLDFERERSRQQLISINGNGSYFL
ncbi:hypothetical protein ASF03_21555 [Rhizobium sp. Leaf68]|nr:hypothetical protein ASE62_21010 [Rhizobium sp. Leaf202]KQN80509.1 hypothetical protein ASF03_21555 [Rhizobium sp. Leaf68]